jgi:hypothetical protein
VAHSPVRSVSTTVAPPENVHRVATSECRWAWRETQRRGTWSSGSGPEHLSGDRDPSFRLHTGFPPHSPSPCARLIRSSPSPPPARSNPTELAPGWPRSPCGGEALELHASPRPSAVRSGPRDGGVAGVGRADRGPVSAWYEVIPANYGVVLLRLAV